MRRKSERERAAMRESCVTLGVAVDAMTRAQHSGVGTTDAVLSGERAAWRAGAQDVRTLFSIDSGRTLRPFDTPVERAVDPLQVYVAVRQFGYWAEGFAVLTAAPNPRARAAGEVLRYAIETIRPGSGCGDVARAITAAVHPLGPHPVTAHVVGNGIGLALEEQSVDYCRKRGHVRARRRLQPAGGRLGRARRLRHRVGDDRGAGAGQRADVVLPGSNAVTALEQLGQHVAASARVSDAARALVELHLIDTVGAWIASTSTQEGKALLDFRATMRAQGGHDPVALDLATRCALARLSEIDDIHLASMTTPGSIVIPGALTIAGGLSACKQMM